jgi:hypothetical protein
LAGGKKLTRRTAGGHMVARQSTASREDSDVPL